MKANQFHTSHLVAAHLFDGYPLDWDQIFQRKAPLAIEVGFGNGEFLVDWAKRRIEWNFVGIDSSLGSTMRLQKRILHYSVHNVRILHNDAPFCLRELFSNNSIQHIVMNFPDPWPKKRHKERRMLRPSYIQTLAAVLTKKGVFELATDQEWLAQECHSLFAKSNRIFETKAIEKNPDRALKTKYEKKWLDSGCEIYHLTAVKIGETKISRMLEDSEMPHCIIESEITPERAAKLKDLEFDESDYMFVVKEVYADIAKASYLLRAISKDVDYRQTFYIVVSKREKEWLIKLDETCPVFRTPAVKLAVNRIGEVLSGAQR